MFQYRFSIIFKPMICFGVEYNTGFDISISIGFIKIIIGLIDGASGYNILDKWVK